MMSSTPALHSERTTFSFAEGECGVLLPFLTTGLGLRARRQLRQDAAATAPAGTKAGKKKQRASVNTIDCLVTPNKYRYGTFGVYSQSVSTGIAAFRQR